MSTLAPNLAHSSLTSAQARARRTREPPPLNWIPSMPGLAPAPYSPTQLTTALASNPEHFPSPPAYSFYHHPSHPGILQSAASSVSSLTGFDSDSSGGPSTSWWLAGIGTQDAQPTASYPEPGDEHCSWQTTDALPSVAPFPVMLASRGAGRPKTTALVDPAAKRTVTSHRTPSPSHQLGSLAKWNASASPTWPKHASTIAVRKSLCRAHGHGASRGNSDSVCEHPTASPPPSRAVPAKCTAATPSASTASLHSASRFSPAQTSAAPTSHTRSILRALRREVKLFSGRMRRDPGRVDERRRNGGEWASVDGSEHENEYTD
ncbi:hypothetical protein C8R44DRAFT_732782 [Mycena epipterygia]|nr:hypothetical protein C8R44DRAFT_732782 [Mycena epipterygia]